MVTDGQDVTEGELLAEFADAPVKDAAVEQAAAAMAEAEAQLARIKAGGRPSDVRAQRDHIAALTAQQDMAQRDAERARTLVPTGAGALAVAERAEAAASRAAALRREALATLESLIASRPEDIALAEAHLQSAVATSARAREDAALSRVFAPVAGKSSRSTPTQVTWSGRMVFWTSLISAASTLLRMSMKPTCRGCTWEPLRR
jgi:HlyD family secretion protein